MKSRLPLFAALLCFIIGFTVMWIGRAILATSIPLMLFVSFWLLMGFLFALRADTTGNLQVLITTFPVIGGIINGRRVTDPQVVPSHDETGGTDAT